MDFEVEQLIGNLEWDSQVSWENGHKNMFSWKVDRSNPKKLLPIIYNGTATIVNGRLSLKVKDSDSLAFDVMLYPIAY